MTSFRHSSSHNGPVALLICELLLHVVSNSNHGSVSTLDTDPDIAQRQRADCGLYLLSIYYTLYVYPLHTDHFYYTLHLFLTHYQCDCIKFSAFHN